MKLKIKKNKNIENLEFSRAFEQLEILLQVYGWTKIKKFTKSRTQHSRYISYHLKTTSEVES